MAVLSFFFFLGLISSISSSLCLLLLLAKTLLHLLVSCSSTDALIRFIYLAIPVMILINPVGSPTPSAFPLLLLLAVQATPLHQSLTGPHRLTATAVCPAYGLSFQLAKELTTGLGSERCHLALVCMHIQDIVAVR